MEKDNPSELLYMCRMGDAHAQYRLFTQYEGLLTSLVNQTIQVYPPVKNYKDDLLQEARLGVLVAMFNPEYYYQYVDAFKQMTQGIMSLSHREVDVMRSWYDGDCYEEAARNQNCTVKAYDGRLQRVRAKIKDYIYHNQ